MNDNLTVFTNEEFGTMRILTIDGDSWFVGKDVAMILGYSNTRDALAAHVDEEDKTVIQKSEIATLEIPNRGLTVINESGLYSLILSSKLPAAKKFKHWVTSEVLPSIRKNGGYILGQETLSDDELLAKALLVAQNKIAERDQRIAEQQQIIEEQAPLVTFANHVSEASNCIDVGQLAKIVHDEGINIGRNKLFKWLKDNEFLMNDNTPYQRYINSGLFEVIETVKTTPYGSKVFPKTLVTGKGQIYLVEKIKAEFGK